MKLVIPPFSTIISSGFEIPVSSESKTYLIRGANGSGKSTMFKLLSSVFEVESGGVKPRFICSDERKFFAEEFSDIIRYLPQNPLDGLFPKLSLKENIMLISDLWHCDSDKLISEIPQKIRAHEDLEISRLSLGQQKIVFFQLLLNSIANSTGAVLGKNDPVDVPTLVLMDEPFAGLDSKREAEAFLQVNAMIEEGKDRGIKILIIDHGHTAPPASEPSFFVEVRTGVFLEFFETNEVLSVSKDEK